MKNLTMTLMFLISLSSSAVVLEIKNICDDGNAFSQEIEIFTNTTAGHLSIHSFIEAGIDFMGNENGIAGLLNTPTGLEGYEVISDNHMKAYGWCYSVDGSQPNVLASEYPIKPNSDCKLTWFYGYAELIDNTWISYCTPVYKKPTEFACGGKI